MNDDSLICFGGTVKALGDGRVGGYLVLFSGPDDPDLQGDYFTKSTDFKTRTGREMDILYRHGVHPVIKSRTLGSAEVEIDEVGVFLHGELELRDNYERAIYKLAELGKLGWSSGALGHLVKRAPKKKAFEVETWALGEASLTPTPVEPRTSAFPIKSLGDEEIDLEAFVKSMDQQEYDQQFSIDGIPSIKTFCEAVSPTSLKDGSQRSKAAVDATKEFITIGKVLGEGFHSYASRLVRRTENRFLKEGREVHPATVQQVESLLGDIVRIEQAFQPIKDALLGIKKISDMSVAEQRAMNERARLAMWELCQTSGLSPEELENAGTNSGNGNMAQP